MTFTEPARTAAARIRRILVIGILAGVAASAAAVGHDLGASRTVTVESRGTGAPVFEAGGTGAAGLDPGLAAELRRARADAAAEGIHIVVNSGRRSREYQESLLREAIARYGSEAEAARWVATPETSPHVSGDAIDVGPAEAMAWLSAHGGVYGLCQIYGNEPWHFELRPAAAADGCPAMYPDPTHDPRMRQ